MALVGARLRLELSLVRGLMNVPGNFVQIKHRRKWLSFKKEKEKAHHSDTEITEKPLQILCFSFVSSVVHPECDKHETVEILPA